MNLTNFILENFMLKINLHVPPPRAHVVRLLDLSTLDLSSATAVSKHYGSSSVLQASDMSNYKLPDPCGPLSRVGT